MKSFEIKGLTIKDGFLMGRGDGSYWETCIYKWWRVGLRARFHATAPYNRQEGVITFTTADGKPCPVRVYFFRKENALLDSRVFG